MITKAVIPVAGLGLRMLPLTKSQPKEMLPLASKPCIQYIVEELVSVGIKEILFITGANKRAIEDHFDINKEIIRKLASGERAVLLNTLQFEDADISIYYTRQKEQLGLGHAIYCAKRFIGDDPFLIALGDSVVVSHENKIFSKRIIEAYEKNINSFVIGTRYVPKEDISKYGIINLIDSFDNNGIGRIEKMVEKPSPWDVNSNLAVAARYIMPSKIFDALDRIPPGKQGEIQLTDAIELIRKEGIPGYAVNLTENEVRYDIGNMGDYYKAFFDLALVDDKFGEQFKHYVVEKMDL